jgi:hypothetical protein
MKKPLHILGGSDLQWLARRLRDKVDMINIRYPLGEGKLAEMRAMVKELVRMTGADA